MKLFFLRADDDNFFQSLLISKYRQQSDITYWANLYNGGFLIRIFFHILLLLYEYSRPPLFFFYVHFHPFVFASDLLGNKNMPK